MNKKEEETIQYYEKELGWVPPFVRILAKYSPGSLDGYLTMHKEVLKEPPKGALPRKTKEMLFFDSSMKFRTPLKSKIFKDCEKI